MLDMSTTENNGMTQHVIKQYLTVLIGFIANPDNYVHFIGVNANGVCKQAKS